MNEGAALRVLSFLNDSNRHHLASIVNEKRKVTVIGEEHEPDEFQEEESSLAVINAKASLLTPEQIKEFFQATEEGSIERLEQLFDATANADPNMTQFTESLLMAAIRAKRHKVAEYLIDQLAINVNYRTELLEFRTQTKIPIRQRTLSCRDLAYNKGMMDLVDLIDIASDEVRPSIKRYIQRRLKARLDEIHQSYLKRMKERSNRLIIQTQEKENKVLEEDEQEKEKKISEDDEQEEEKKLSGDDEQEKENEEPSTVNITDDTNLPPPPPPIPPVVHRPYKSHIEATIQSIASSSNDKSIDEAGKKIFRFSGYTLRFRFMEAADRNHQINEQFRSKTASPSLPIVLPTSTRSFPPSPRSRPMTTSITTNINRRPISGISTQIPIRETRTSICRSARRIATPRIAPTVHSENKPEIKPTITTINTFQRLLPKRIHQNNTNYGYISQLQHAMHNEPQHFTPETLKTTVIGLPFGTRLIRN